MYFPVGSLNLIVLNHKIDLIRDDLVEVGTRSIEAHDAGHPNRQLRTGCSHRSLQDRHNRKTIFHRRNSVWAPQRGSSTTPATGVF
jgi:hypothetical protein